MLQFLSWCFSRMFHEETIALDRFFPNKSKCKSIFLPKGQGIFHRIQLQKISL